MTKAPFVSVVLPVFNCGKYIREAVESILKQTYTGFEFLIINDGSTDESLQILNDYANKDSRVKIINQHNSGIVVALNRGLIEAKGEWVFRMDGDDISLPHRIEMQTKMVRGDASLVLVGGWCQQINPEGIPLKINKYPSKHDELIDALENAQAFYPHSSACFRRDTVMELGGYRERFRHAEDYDLWLRLSSVGKFSCCQNVILQLRKHPKNISNLSSGHIQQLRAIAAAICHFRRKAGLSDPSQMTEELWQDFLAWVQKRMDAEGYFQRMQGWQVLRNAWYSNLETNKLKRGRLVLKQLIQNPSARKAFWGRFRKENLALKLAEESRRIW
jgi:hypothetical protein